MKKKTILAIAVFVLAIVVDTAINYSYVFVPDRLVSLEEALALYGNDEFSSAIDAQEKEWERLELELEAGKISGPEFISSTMEVFDSLKEEREEFHRFCYEQNIRL